MPGCSEKYEGGVLTCRPIDRFYQRQKPEWSRRYDKQADASRDRYGSYVQQKKNKQDQKGFQSSDSRTPCHFYAMRIFAVQIHFSGQCKKSCGPEDYDIQTCQTGERNRPETNEGQNKHGSKALQLGRVHGVRSIRGFDVGAGHFNGLK